MTFHLTTDWKRLKQISPYSSDNAMAALLRLKAYLKTCGTGLHLPELRKRIASCNRRSASSLVRRFDLARNVCHTWSLSSFVLALAKGFFLFELVIIQIYAITASLCSSKTHPHPQLLPAVLSYEACHCHQLPLKQRVKSALRHCIQKQLYNRTFVGNPRFRFFGFIRAFNYYTKDQTFSLYFNLQ